MNPTYDIAAYYWPAYHDDPRWRPFMPKGEGEWQIIRESKPKFDGHLQPRVPTWGYTDESEFSIYELGTLVEGLGGMEATRDALNSLRARVCEAGFPGLHIQAMLWGNIPESVSMVPGDDTPTQDKTISALGIDSLTNYQWVHYVKDNSWNEWSEGSYLEPDTTHGMGYLEAVRDAIAERTSQGGRLR